MTGRPNPVADELTAPFWEAAARGELVIQRCGECRRYHHPPRPYCQDCGSAAVSFESVSGRGHVYSYTRTESGARHPFFTGSVPYLVGLVELVEQERLLLLSNFPGAALDEVTVGREVDVEFADIGGGKTLPQFRIVDGQEG